MFSKNENVSKIVLDARITSSQPVNMTSSGCHFTQGSLKVDFLGIGGFTSVEVT